MTVQEKMLRLARALLDRTNARQVSWEVGPSRDVFIASVGAHSVGVRKVRDDYLIELVDSDGNVMDSASDLDLANAPGGSGAFQLLTSLHQAARRVAFGVDEALDSLLGDLEKENRDSS